jgi:S1-C subfamily serine protease
VKALCAAAVLATLAACAQPAAAPSPSPSEESLVPGTIGITVRQQGDAVVVSAVRPGSRAATAGVRTGDVVVRYNGEPVGNARGFYRMVLDSRPGSVARLELRRAGALESLELPVEQLDTMPRV